MGQARKKVEIKVDLNKMAKERAAYRWTLPMRIIKGVSGLVLFLPFTLVCFAYESYRQNQWPWELR